MLIFVKIPEETFGRLVNIDGDTSWQNLHQIIRRECHIKDDTTIHFVYTIYDEFKATYDVAIDNEAQQTTFLEIAANAEQYGIKSIKLTIYNTEQLHHAVDTYAQAHKMDTKIQRIWNSLQLLAQNPVASVAEDIASSISLYHHNTDPPGYTEWSKEEKTAYSMSIYTPLHVKCHNVSQFREISDQSWCHCLFGMFRNQEIEFITNESKCPCCQEKFDTITRSLARGTKAINHWFLRRHMKQTADFKHKSLSFFCEYVTNFKLFSNLASIHKI